MTPYADEAFYKNTYLSGREAVIAAAFPFYAMQASTEIRRYIGVNLPDGQDVPDAVKYCCCELAEMLYRHEKAEAKSGGIASESVQGWSKSYESTESRKAALQSDTKHCIYKWLGDTGLLFRGICSC